MGFGDRPTADLIMIFLAGVVGLVAFAACVIGVAALFVRPDADLSRLASILATMMASLVSALVGYVAGRGTRPPE